VRWRAGDGGSFRRIGPAGSSGRGRTPDSSTGDGWRTGAPR
jgi:hypothetical protein